MEATPGFSGTDIGAGPPRGSQTDILSAAERSARMSLIRSRNTRPEMVVRSLIFRMGYRYRLHARELPGAPDIVFRPKSRVIFVHGCFWHGHEGCVKNRPPKSNRGYWEPKLEGNKRRDLQAAKELDRRKWDVLVVWECETEGDLRDLSGRLIRFLGER